AHLPSAPSRSPPSLHDALPISTWSPPPSPPGRRIPCCPKGSRRPPRATRTPARRPPPHSTATPAPAGRPASPTPAGSGSTSAPRSEEHTSELQSQSNLVCRLLL